MVELDTAVTAQLLTPAI